MKKAKSVTLGPKLIQKVQAEADKESRSFSSMLEYIVKKFFIKKEEK